MSTEAKHTPGPRGEPLVSGDRKTVTLCNDHDGWHRLEVDVCSDDCDFGTAMANARLIAAAPDLLAACEYALDMFQQPVGAEKLYERIGALGGYRAVKLLGDALAKATGTGDPT